MEEKTSEEVSTIEAGRGIDLRGFFCETMGIVDLSKMAESNVQKEEEGINRNKDKTEDEDEMDKRKLERYEDLENIAEEAGKETNNNKVREDNMCSRKDEEKG